MAWRRWFDGRRGMPAAPPGDDAPRAGPPGWDAVIDLDPGGLCAGTSRAAAAMAVRAAVQALPGAGWVSVEMHALHRPTAVRLFPAGTGVEVSGEPWEARRRTVAAAIEEALAAPALPATTERGPTGFDGPALPAPGAGFAEAPLAQLAALRDLSALASVVQAVRPPAAPATRPVATPDRTGVELLARLLAFVLPGDGRHEAAAAVQRFGGFANALAAPERELREVPGLGTHSIAAIKLVHAAALRLARSGLSAQPVLDSRERLYGYLSAVIARERIEQFRILFLDRSGMLRADEVQGTGTVNHTPVYPREVVRRALELEAAAIVLVHNHPSGDPTPSPDDIAMTARVQDAARALSIVVRDHVIVGAGRWVSLAESGLMAADG